MQLFTDDDSASTVDDPLEQVAAWWLMQPNGPTRVGEVLRRSFDEVLDGHRTGRFIYEDLANTEKTYVGTKVEILLRDEFDLPRGPEPKRLDFAVGGHAADCKFTQDSSWMIPPEAVDELCVLISASDVTARFSFGILRCSLDRLRAPNRDKKRGITKAGRQAATWLWTDHPMPENLLRNLPAPTLSAVFATPGKGNGQTRANELFRRVHDVIIRREVTLTVAQQSDSMKRARDARGHLEPEGIIILGHQKQHPRIARDLGLPVPRKGEFVATRVVAATPLRLSQRRPQSVINGATWVKATTEDPLERGPSYPY